MINISFSRGETVKDVEINDPDVYYKKTKVFRDWDKKGSSISNREKKLLSLYSEQMTKEKEIKSQPVNEASEEGKVFKVLIEGMVRSEPPKIIEGLSQTPVADSILEPSIKPSKRKEEPQIAELENKFLIYGNDFERNCHWEKNDCGFSIYHEVEQYHNKLNPKKKSVDTAKYPLDF